MAWNKKLTQLNDALGELVPHTEGIAKFVKNAGLKPQMIDFHGNALDIWSNVLSEADKRNKVDALVTTVLDKYPENPFLKSALGPKLINYTLDPDLDEVSEWKGVDADTLEKLTFGYNTLLPINFLERGIVCSRSVAKIEIRSGTELEVGTGFLCNVTGINEVFFITNYHVINDKKFIGNTRLIFDYEEDANGNTKASRSFRIKEIGPWYTSPVTELDVCIFQLQCNPSEIADFRSLRIDANEVRKNDFVNIIQHPAGQMKQISLYHNIVTSVDERITQYLTDTLKGSSGAPVFNSNWDVVAVHHSGGVRKPGEVELPIGARYRNEGIRTSKIAEFIKSNHNA